MEGFSAVLFYSPNYSIWASRVIKREGIETKMIPVPRHLSSDCGYCVRINNIDIEIVKKLLAENNIEFDSIKCI